MKKSQPHRRPLQLHKDTVRALDPVLTATKDSGADPRLSARAKVVMEALAAYAARPAEEWGQP